MESEKKEKIILGIDPGTTIMGFGLIKVVNKKMSFIQLNELILKKYDKDNTETHLEDLPENATFQTENGRKFKKGVKRRTRYLCLNIMNNRQYLFHPLTPVQKF